MKCKKHPYELGVGVCASCLRERLLDLIATQNELPTEHHHLRPDPPPQPPPPALVFPRSVSPYVSHRRSVGSEASAAYGRRYNHRFFSTPQVGPTFDAASDGFPGDAAGGRRRISGRFSVFSILFRHQRSEEVESDLGSSKSSGSGSWFSALIRRRRKKKSRSFSVEEVAATGRSQPSCRASDRGMSPVIDDDEADGCSSITEGSHQRYTNIKAKDGMVVPCKLQPLMTDGLPQLQWINNICKHILCGQARRPKTTPSRPLKKSHMLIM